MVANLVKSKSQLYSCQRRQLRTRCLKPSRVPSDWSRACASRALSGAQASYYTRSWKSLFGAASLNFYRNRSWCSLTVGLLSVKFKDWSKHVEPLVADWRTRVQFPPPPPNISTERDVKGIQIIDLDEDLRLKRALSVTNNIDFYSYKVSFSLSKGG